MTSVTSISNEGIRGVRWGWLLALGALFLILGVIGLGMTYQLTAVAIFWFGILAIVGGIAQLIDAAHHKGWKGIVWHVIIALAYIVAGIILITSPLSSAFWLTLFIAITLVVTGISRIFIAFQVRGQGGGWVLVLLSGLISIVLGVLIYSRVTPPGAEQLASPEGQLQWFAAWGGFIGLFVAVELIMEGVALISIALSRKSAPA